MKAALLLFSDLTVCAQDPYQTSAQNYSSNLRMSGVRVSRVSYRPGDKLPVHDHPTLPTVFVYVTDGGPVLFGHQEFAAMRRPAVKAGQIRFNRGNKETHTTDTWGIRPPNTSESS